MASYEHCNSAEDAALCVLIEAAEGGDTLIQTTLGLSYYNGDGVPRNKQQAYHWLHRAAALNYPMAMVHLGECYTKDGNTAEGQKWSRKAFERFYDADHRGDASAQYNLALCYLRGVGVKSDPKESFSWLTKAAAQGNENAKNLLREVQNMKHNSPGFFKTALGYMAVFLRLLFRLLRWLIAAAVLFAIISIFF